MLFLVRRFQVSLPALSKREGPQLGRRGEEGVSQNNNNRSTISSLSWWLYIFKSTFDDFGGYATCSAVCLDCHLGLPFVLVSPGTWTWKPLPPWRIGNAASWGIR